MSSAAETWCNRYQFQFCLSPTELVAQLPPKTFQGRELQDKPHVVIATPGRLANHLNTCDTFSLSQIRYLVMDEADRLLDGSFDDDLGDIFGRLSKKRQTLLFTATVTDALKKLREGEEKKGEREGKKPMFFYTVRDMVI